MSRLTDDRVLFRIPPNSMITGGVSSFIHGLDAVVKIAKPDCVEHHLVECAIYMYLGPHPGILDVYQLCQGGHNLLMLQKMDMSLRTLLQRTDSRPFSDKSRVAIAISLAKTYGYIHENEVYHVDIGAHNICINVSQESVKLCDFAGSSLRGSTSLVSAGIRAQCPWNDGPSVATELFAFGSLLYELSAGHEPYHDKTSSEVEQSYQQKQFPPSKVSF